MYAIVEIAGQQFKVQKNQRVYVHRLEANEGSQVEFDKVLLLEKDGKVQVGTPVVDGAKVAATVLNHLKGDKVLVFKKKRRKGYKVMNGHRQFLTQILIQGVLGKGETLKKSDLIEVKKPVTKKEEIVETETAEEDVKEVKKAPAKKAAAKKSASARKAPAKKSAKKKKD
ncbi:MAG: 50S ribosomal protein L21 [Bacteroidota bacterium]